MWNHVASQITQVTGQPFAGNHRRSVGGGSINQAYAVSDDRTAYFVKLNQASRVAMFEAEAIALEEMSKTQTIRVPRPICYGTVEASSYIVLEWFDLAYGDHQAWEMMGRNLAKLHHVTSSQGFGWHQNNTIGSTPQVNPWTKDWIEFLTVHRLEYQFKLAQQRGGTFTNGDRLLEKIPEFFADYTPIPSLVHGDLWTGNAAVTIAGEPIIFDPAAYYGDREVDLAMSQLFGSFPADFYSAYNEVFPLAAGYSQRKILYNLYHILNHFNLFGGSYASQANQMINTLI
jgi:fructosamine-3-kinase